MNLIEPGPLGGYPRVLVTARLEGECWERALRLLLAVPARRLRVELEGPCPNRGTSWLRPLEAASRAALRQTKELDCVWRGIVPPPPAAARRLAAMGGRAIVEAGLCEAPSPSVRRSLMRFERMGLHPILEAALAPEDMAGLSARLERLGTLAPARVRFTVRAGKPFGAQAGAVMEAGLSSWLGRAGSALEVLNFWDEEEPAFLASALALTAEGELGWATAIAHGDLWPQFRRAAPPAPVRRIRSLARLFMAPARRGRWAGRVLSGPARALWLDNIGISLRMRSFLGRPFPGRRDGSENKSMRRGLIAATLVEQDRFLRSRLSGVGSAFYFVRSGCVNDCVFCKSKAPQAGQTLAEVAGFLRENLLVGRRKIALVGNEPLLHTRIEQILRLCRRYGFAEVEVMTSGTLLSDPGRARALRDAGATAFAIPLYAARPAEHDALTGREGSFAAAVKGIENLRRLGLGVHIHSNLMKPNLGSLAALECLVVREWSLPFGVLPLRAKDPHSMNRPYRELEPSYRELIRAGLRLRSVAGLPLCIQNRLGAGARDGGALQRLADGIKLYLLHQSFVKPSSCGRCPERAACPGVFREHMGLHPGDLRLLAPPPAGP